MPDYPAHAVKIPSVLIMAAGRGTRMRSRLPKVLHPVCGRPLLLWPVEAAREAGAERIVVVLGPDAEAIRSVLPPDVEVAVQDPPAGTGHAVLQARQALRGARDVIVLSGDHPLLDAGFVTALAERHAVSGAAATVTTRELDDPGQYGRIVRDASGDVERIVETKTPGDATAEELAIREVNAGTYAFAVEPLFEALERVGTDNAQGEMYLGDALPLLREAGGRVAAYLTDDEGVSLGINTRADLAAVQAQARRRILERHMLAGVTIADPDSTFVDADVRIGEDTTIEPFTLLRGRTEVGPGCTVGPGASVVDSVLGDGTTVLHSHLNGCEALAGCSIGPFAHIRPGTTLRAGAKAGSFVEIKNSDIGEHTKVPHLSYVGDASLGERTNLGAGTITANYDGHAKHRTVIGSEVKTGVHTSFVAPVSVGDRAYTGAGSVITDDVPRGALGIARCRQESIEGYADERDRAAAREGAGGRDSAGGQERAEGRKGDDR
jgi:bifunctional UDP-N-acetylglucosamine pyrophosphorylase/glucosamine-1-phosphate N-acetyltransferase